MSQFQDKFQFQSLCLTSFKNDAVCFQAMDILIAMISGFFIGVKVIRQRLFFFVVWFQTTSASPASPQSLESVRWSLWLYLSEWSFVVTLCRHPVLHMHQALEWWCLWIVPDCRCSFFILRWLAARENNTEFSDSDILAFIMTSRCRLCFCCR